MVINYIIIKIEIIENNNNDTSDSNNMEDISYIQLFDFHLLFFQNIHISIYFTYLKP